MIPIIYPYSMPPQWQTPTGNLPNTAGPKSPYSFDGDVFVANVVAIDPNNKPITYYLANGTLPLGTTLNPKTGQISGTLSLENIYEVLDTSSFIWSFDIQATNDVTSSTRNFAIQISIIQPPIWITSSGLIGGDIVGNTISYTLQAVDPQGSPLIYSISTNSIALPSGVFLYSNGLVSGNYPAVIPPDDTFTYFTANATNGLYTISRDFYLDSFYVNTPPVWISPSPNLGLFDANYAPNIIFNAVSPDGLPITYSLIDGILPDGLDIGFNSIIGTIALTSEATQYTFTIEAADSDVGVSDMTFTMTITSNEPPVWSTPKGYLGGGFVGSSFIFQLVAGTPEGFPTPLTYTIANGALPSGITMTSGGLISGIIPQVSTSTLSYFTVSASDGVANTNQDFSILSQSIVAYPPLWVTAPGNVATSASLDNVSLNFIATNNNSNPQGTLNYSIIGGQIPDGLLLTSVNNVGILSGSINPTANAVMPFTIAALDGISIIPRTFSYTINNPGPVTVGYSTPSTFTVPRGVHQIMLNWVIGGGGGGGESTSHGNGAAGGGGGSGGFYHYFGNVACNTGDIFTFNVGNSGIGGRYPTDTGTIPPPNSTKGGDTIVLLNGVPIVTATGGGGAPSATNTGSGFNSSPGGLGGSPKGSQGVFGPPGTTPFSNPAGSPGPVGPLNGSISAPGGVAGGPGNPSGASAGANAVYSGAFQAGPAVGYGSGGGGGGVSHGATGGIGWWYGGNGAPGYVEITYPSSGSIGGSLAGLGNNAGPPLVLANIFKSGMNCDNIAQNTFAPSAPGNTTYQYKDSDLAILKGMGITFLRVAVDVTFIYKSSIFNTSAGINQINTNIAYIQAKVAQFVRAGFYVYLSMFLATNLKTSLAAAGTLQTVMTAIYTLVGNLFFNPSLPYTASNPYANNIVSQYYDYTVLGLGLINEPFYFNTVRPGDYYTNWCKAGTDGYSDGTGDMDIFIGSFRAITRAHYIVIDTIRSAKSEYIQYQIPINDPRVAYAIHPYYPVNLTEQGSQQNVSDQNFMYPRANAITYAQAGLAGANWLSRASAAGIDTSNAAATLPFTAKGQRQFNIVGNSGRVTVRDYWGQEVNLTDQKKFNPKNGKYSGVYGVDSYINAAVIWASNVGPAKGGNSARANLFIFVEEIGCTAIGPSISRLNWVRDVISVCNKYNLGRAWWAFAGAIFGLRPEPVTPAKILNHNLITNPTSDAYGYDADLLPLLSQ